MTALGYILYMDTTTATPSPLTLAHLAADHRIAAGDFSDLLPGIDPAKAQATSARIIRSDYHRGCPICALEVAEDDYAADQYRQSRMRRGSRPSAWGPIIEANLRALVDDARAELDRLGVA